MKTSFVFFILLLATQFRSSAQPIYLGTSDSVSFFSETPIEDIDARSGQAVGAVNQSTKDVFFKVPMKSFVFKKALMQEHFNENYMESDKFPYATFKGKITDNVDLSQDGTYTVSVSGDLTIHGVTKPRTIPGTIIVKGNTMEVKTAFDVKVADHGITVPSVVTKHIAEVISVKVHGPLTLNPR